ncbi:MAG: right-handed parallel beta-helix repeat-containing protein, partial [Patescibacteria group bacterium]
SHLGGLGDLIESATQIFNTPISNYDLKTILTQIHSEIKTRKIILVGHSQGSFYTNEIYDYLVKNGAPSESISIYNIGTPASFVSGNGNYLTSKNDKVINKIRDLALKINTPQPLPQNIELPLNKEKDSENGHSFSEDYLKNAPGRIISEIDILLKKLETNQITENKVGCFNLPDKNFAYKTQKVLFSIADPISNETIVLYGETKKIIISTSVFVINKTQEAIIAVVKTTDKIINTTIINYQEIISQINNLFGKENVSKNTTNLTAAIPLNVSVISTSSVLDSGSQKALPFETPNSKPPELSLSENSSSELISDILIAKNSYSLTPEQLQIFNNALKLKSTTNLFQQFAYSGSGGGGGKIETPAELIIEQNEIIIATTTEAIATATTTTEIAMTTATTTAEIATTTATSTENSTTTISTGPTYLTGALTENTTFTSEGNPYIIETSFLIPENIILTINPGVIIWPKAKGPFSRSLIVDGTLIINGTKENPVKFTSLNENPQPGDYTQAIVFTPKSKNSLINNAIFEYGDPIAPVDSMIEVSGTKVIFKNSIFRKSLHTALFLINSDSLIENCIFEDNSNIGISTFGGQVQIFSSIFKNNIIGINLFNKSEINLDNNYFTKNQKSISLSSDSIITYSENNKMGDNNFDGFFIKHSLFSGEIATTSLSSLSLINTLDPSPLNHPDLLTFWNFWNEANIATTSATSTEENI